MEERSFSDLFADAEKRPEYWQELAVLDFTNELVGSMERMGLTRAELARKLGTSPAYVTKLLGGNANFTLMTMTKLAMAVDSEIHLHLAPRGARTWWVDDLAGVWAAGEECCYPPLSGTGMVTVTTAPSAIAAWNLRPVTADYFTTAVSEEGAPDGQAAAAA